MTSEPLAAPSQDRSSVRQAIERLTLGAGILGLVVGLGTLIHDMPKAYQEGRLSAARLSHLDEPLSPSLLAKTTPVIPVTTTETAEALPPADPAQ
jgi:hypothetical protein